VSFAVVPKSFAASSRDIDGQAFVRPFVPPLAWEQPARWLCVGHYCVARVPVSLPLFSPSVRRLSPDPLPVCTAWGDGVEPRFARRPGARSFRSGSSRFKGP
jgi:hypothetical protein